MIRPTPRAVLLFSLGIPIALLMLVWNPALWPFSFDLSLLALLVIAIDALLIPPRRALIVDLQAPIRLPVGNEGRIDVTLRSTRSARPLRIEAVVDLDGPLETPPMVAGRFGGAPEVLSIPFTALRRGVVTLEALWLRWRGPLGLVEWRLKEELARKIEILPAARMSFGPAIQALSKSAIYGTKTQNQKGEGTEFDTLREHVAGLDSRMIDWKQSARHRKLLSKEFRIERNHQIVLAFDTGHLMLEPIDGLARLDHAIEAGLMLGWTGLRAGDLVGSFGFDATIRHYLEPGRGSTYYARLQRSAAQLAYHTEETNFTLGLAELNARLKRRALVVLFTEFVDSVMAELLIESLKRMANRHAVIFVTLQDPLTARLANAEPEDFTVVAEAVVAHDFARERAIVMERIARLGVHCVDVPVGGLSVALLNRYLQIKQEGLL
ncbi:DUF58 domain-containing protein [Labrys neptuniae]